MAARQVGAWALVCAAAAAAQTEHGTVLRVADGDTLWLQADHGGAPVRLRLLGIDAPEICQPWGPEARRALEQRVLARRVEWRVERRDEFGRDLGSLRLDGDDVGAALVRDGHAWSYRWRDDHGPYIELERQARAARRGLFARGDAEPPRRFRHRHGPCDSAPASAPGR